MHIVFMVKDFTEHPVRLLQFLLSHTVGQIVFSDSGKSSFWSEEEREQDLGARPGLVSEK